jgi:hypothetical protein
MTNVAGGQSVIRRQYGKSDIFAHVHDKRMERMSWSSLTI